MMMKSAIFVGILACLAFTDARSAFPRLTNDELNNTAESIRTLLEIIDPLDLEGISTTILDLVDIDIESVHVSGISKWALTEIDVNGNSANVRFQLPTIEVSVRNALARINALDVEATISFLDAVVNGIVVDVELSYSTDPIIQLDTLKATASITGVEADVSANINGNEVSLTLDNESVKKINDWLAEKDEVISGYLLRGLNALLKVLQ